jgi:hypothetical protein
LRRQSPIGVAIAPVPSWQTLEAIDEIDHVVEPAAGATTDAASRNGDGNMRLAGAGPADQHGVALLGDEPAAGEVVDERLVDRGALKREVGEILGGPLPANSLRFTLASMITPASRSSSP